jgi:hypothetical protein
MTDHQFGRDIDTFCSNLGLPLPLKIKPIRAGRNSKVYRIRNGIEQWILKKYFKSSVNHQDRLGTEFKFLVFMNQVGVTCIPEALGMDHNLQCALYSFLPGHRFSVVSEAHITQAADFIRSINQFRNNSLAVTLPVAVDACFSCLDHIDLTKKRFSRFMLVEPKSDIEKDANEFIEKRLLPLWSSVMDKLFKENLATYLAKPLTQAERILSPSDFGFHNTLEHEGNLSFVDFEYAGWDDPAKLICDFICQPELPITENQARKFSDQILWNFPHAEAVIQRVDKLLMVHRLKWCCILLNEFREEGRERRLHAGLDSEGLLETQLSKAKSYFNLHLAPIT